MKDTSFGRTPVEAWEIDMFFGWNEMEMSKDMQLHYASKSLFDRIMQARITCMM